VRIIAFDGNRALVAGGGLFGPWSIWMDSAQLRRTEPPDDTPPRALLRLEAPRDFTPKGDLMDPSTPTPKANREKSLPATEKKEKRARELDWENEGGRVRKDEERSAEAPRDGNVSNDSGADAA
jgi:hypothetical protein